MVDADMGIIPADTTGRKVAGPQELENVKLSRVEMCGKVWASGVRRDNGQYRQFKFLCGQWRECPICHALRSKKFFHDIQRAISEFGTIYYVELTPEEAIELVRDLHKNLYRRMPMMNGLEAVFYIPQNDEQREMGQEVTWTNTNDGKTFAWKDIVNTPARRRTSGGLGRAKAPKEGGQVSLIYIVTDAPAKVREAAFDKAVAQTIDADPQTSKEVAEAHQKRMELYEKFLIEEGYHITAHSRKNERVDLESLDWLAGLKANKPDINDYQECGNCLDIPSGRKPKRYNLSDPDQMNEYNRVTRAA